MTAKWNIAMATAIIGIGFTLSPQAAAQGSYDGVVGIYQASCRNPESFGAQQLQRDPRILKCLGVVERTYMQAGMRHMQMCEQMPAQYRWDCIKEDTAGELWIWAMTMRQVAEGKLAFSRSDLGGMMILGKQMSSMMGINWTAMCDLATQVVRPMITCTK